MTKRLLSISEAVIFKGEGRTFEHARRIQEVDAVSLQVDPTFPFVPGEAHMRTVYTAVREVKTASFSALTFHVSREQRALLFASRARSVRELHAVVRHALLLHVGAIPLRSLPWPEGP